MCAYIDLPFCTPAGSHGFQAREMLCALLRIQGEVMLHKLLLSEFLHKFTGAKLVQSQVNHKFRGHTTYRRRRLPKKMRERTVRASLREELGCHSLFIVVRVPLAPVLCRRCHLLVTSPRSLPEAGQSRPTWKLDDAQSHTLPGFLPCRLQISGRSH